MLAEITISCWFTTKGDRQFRLHSFRNAHGFNGISDVVQKDREFITTESGQRIVVGRPVRYFAHARTRDRVGSPHRVLQSLPDLNQQLIAGRVSQAVVDDFEFVDINEQYREFVVRVSLGEG